MFRFNRGLKNNGFQTLKRPIGEDVINQSSAIVLYVSGCGFIRWS